MQTVTMEDVARAAGVSRALVSLAYRDAYGVSPETRETILAAGKKLGYRPNRVAAQLAGKQQLTVGVYLQDLHNEIFADIFDGIREVADTAGKHLVLTVGRIDGSRDIEALETLLENRVDIIIAAGLTVSDKALKRYTSRTRIVSVSRVLPGADSVYSDNQHGAELATQHLIDAGHSQIAFISNPPSDGYMDRRIGYERTMLAASLSPRVIEGSYSRNAVAEITLSLLGGPNAPTAIFAHNDQAAMGVMDALKELTLKPGIDLAVVGYDNSSISKSPTSALTTVDVRGSELGRLAAEVAMARLESPDQATILKLTEPTLVVRSTS